MDQRFNRVTQRRRRGQRGFTLIELLVVIAVLGILAAIVMFNVVGVSNRGSSSACATDLKTVQTASDAYYSDHNGQYPNSLQDLVSGGYIHTAPKDLGNLNFNSDGHGTVSTPNCSP